MASYYRRLKELLEANGCEFVRQGKGSHEVWYSPITKRRFPLAYDCPVRHTANEILKEAGIDEKV